MAAQLIASAPEGVGAPAFGADGSLYVVVSSEGTICRVDEEAGDVVEASRSSGQLSGMAVDASGAAYVADLALGALMQRSGGPDDAAAGEGGGEDALSWETTVVEYEGEPLLGPSSVAVAGSGNVYFTDSGPLGASTLEHPTGSVMAVVGSGDARYLKPLVLRSLAHPCAVAVGATDNVVYVAELLRNRLLRLVQRPVGVFHASVFHQFSGRLGPSAVAVDPAPGGSIYVALFDARESGAESGLVAVLGPDGERRGEVEVPGPEVSGLALSPDGSHLIVTEASTGGVYRVKL